MKDRYIFVILALVCLTVAVIFISKKSDQTTKNIRVEDVVSMEKEIRGISQQENFLPLSPKTFSMILFCEEEDQMTFTSLKGNFNFVLPGKNTLYFLETAHQKILLGLSEEEAQAQVKKINFEVAWANFLPWLALALAGSFIVGFGGILKKKKDKTWLIFVIGGVGCVFVWIVQLVLLYVRTKGV